MEDYRRFMNEFVHGTPRRTMGSETEFTMDPPHSLIHAVNPNLLQHANSANELWLKNGARLYIDKGHDYVVEYATPECMSGSQVLLHEKVGHTTVRSLLYGSDETALERRPSVFKRTGYGMVLSSVDEKNEVNIIQWPNVSTGHHETYQTGLTMEALDFYRPFLDAYLATRIVWSGSGMVADDGYRLSQKAEAIDFKGWHLITHGSKKPLRYKGKGRIEIRTGEGNMSDWAVARKFDMTSLVFRLMEHGQVPFNRLIDEGRETDVFRQASRDPTEPVPSEGFTIDAIDIQARIAEYALDFAEINDVPKDEIIAAQEVLKACQDLNGYFLDYEDLSVISDRIDWAAKLDKLRSRGISLGQATCANMIAVAHDLSWEDISPNGASERWYRSRQRAIYSNADIRRASVTPPSSRAKLRTDIVRRQGNDVGWVNWHEVVLKGNDDPTIKLDELTEPSQP